MGWSIGYDSNWKRDIGYGVPAECDHPKCSEEINRGLAYVCGNDVYGGEEGCGLFFCAAHQINEKQQCEKCFEGKEPFKPKSDTQEWRDHKRTHESWAPWRAENLEAAVAL